MESRVSSLERLVSEQIRVISEKKTDLSIIKDTLLWDMKEIKELLQDIKKGKKRSDGGEKRRG